MLGRPAVRPVLTVLVLFTVWRGTLFAVDALGASLTTERERNPYRDYRIEPHNYVLDGWFRWDSGWYRRVVERGYYIETQQSDVTFFPGFPYAARILGKVLGGPYVAGLVLSNLCLLFALLYVYLLARDRAGESAAAAAVAFALCFPGSFFFSAFYAEGMFFLAAAGSMYGYARRQYVVAGLWGALAAFTRPTGLVLLPAYAADYLLRVGRREEKLSPRALGLLLVAAGLGAFMLILWQSVGDPLAFAHFQSGWGRHRAWPLTPIWETLRDFDWSFPRGSEKNMDFVEAAFAIAFLVLPILMAVRRAPVAEWLFVLLAVLMTLSSGKVQSMVRHGAACFPVFIYFAEVTERRPNLRLYLVFAFSLLLLFFNLRFANWYWSG